MKERRMLLDLQVIQAGSTPTPSAQQSGGGLPSKKRIWSQDVDLALLLFTLGVISLAELAAIVANN